MEQRHNAEQWFRARLLFSYCCCTYFPPGIRFARTELDVIGVGSTAHPLTQTAAAPRRCVRYAVHSRLRRFALITYITQDPSWLVG